MKLLYGILYLAHTCGCIWYYIARKELESGKNNTWLHLNNLIDENFYDQYINALFYSVLTMITVGHFSVTSSTEKAISIILVLALSGAFAYSLNRIGIILEYMFKSEVELK